MGTSLSNHSLWFARSKDTKCLLVPHDPPMHFAACFHCASICLSEMTGYPFLWIRERQPFDANCVHFVHSVIGVAAASLLLEVPYQSSQWHPFPIRLRSPKRFVGTRPHAPFPVRWQACVMPLLSSVCLLELQVHQQHFLGRHPGYLDSCHRIMKYNLQSTIIQGKHE